MAKTLTREEAEEYTKNLGNVAVGNFGLMEFAMHTLQVPKALGLSNEDWVQDRLGGYIRWSVEQRRDAVRELSGEKSETGRYERSAKQVAQILGIGEQTVKRDREVWEALEGTASTREPAQIEENGTASTPKKATVAEQRAEIRAMIDSGKSNAEIAVTFDRGVATIEKERAAYNKEKEPGPSDKLAEQKAAKKAAMDEIPEAEKKAAEASFDEFVDTMRSSFSQAAGVYLEPLLAQVRQEVRRVMDNDLEIPEYEETVGAWAEIGSELWVYGAKRGHDVSRIAEQVNRFRGGEQT